MNRIKKILFFKDYQKLKEIEKYIKNINVNFTSNIRFI